MKAQMLYAYRPRPVYSSRYYFEKPMGYTEKGDIVLLIDHFSGRNSRLTIVLFHAKFGTCYAHDYLTQPNFSESVGFRQLLYIVNEKHDF
jgi:hypothetical protein